jgi:serine/threonine protein kinase
MDPAARLPDDQLDAPSRIFERLRQIAGYAWDDTQPPFHTTYDNWHVHGTKFVSPYSTGNGSASSPAPYYNHAASPSAQARLGASGRPSPSERVPSSAQSETGSEASNTVSPPIFPPPPVVDAPVVEEQVIAKVSYNVLREERAFHIARSLVAGADPNALQLVKPLDLIRLAAQPGDRGSIVVVVYEYPGPNHIFKMLDLGPAFYFAEKQEDKWIARGDLKPELDPPVTLQRFLDFAIGATQCLETIHHGQGIIHGEIRGDAFHYNIESNKVKLVAFGSGLRSFEHGLTSTGWSALSKEMGAKSKLQYISPEQTGRMPAEPDTRTDIYSLGVLFWTLLTQQPVFQGETPLDIVQGVLGRRIPNVSAIRLDIPDVVGRIIQKCTSKNVSDRYFSASGLRYDLVEVQRLLGDGDWVSLKEWPIASRDISSFFMLPSAMIGRDKERAELLKVIERVAKSHAQSQKGGANRFSDGSILSTEHLDGHEGSSDGASSAEGTNRQSGSFTQTVVSETKWKNSFFPGALVTDAATGSGETISSANSGGRTARPWDRQQSVYSFDAVSFGDGAPTESSPRHSAVTATTTTTDSSSSLSRQLGSAKFRKQGHCEIVTIEGAGGLGKSCLVQSILPDVRRRGYCATAKFDTPGERLSGRC